ncbi:MAG: fatty acid desaturase [Acidobacteria bacterium]|nr:fatty acid desaturase [Acidobacteriota bacterium]
METLNPPNDPTLQSLRKRIAPFAGPDRRKALLQIADTLIPYLACWAALVWLVQRKAHPVVIAATMVVAAFLLVRIFILFHDCTHGSFFASRGANTALGYVTGILTFTPYHHWRHNHLVHHNTCADLDRRGLGDISTLTVEEYRAAPGLKRLGYRVLRTPFFLVSVGQAFFFLVAQRFPPSPGEKRERLSVAFTNLALAAILGIAAFTIGLGTFLLVQIPIMVLAGALGMWLFYVQHQFEGVYWSRHAAWDPLKAALQGSSFYRLPRVLQWFTGNIGFHHIHHALPRIPNYRLQACCEQTPQLRDVAPLTLRGSLKSLSLNLYDEQRKKLVSFRSLKLRE